MKKSRTSEAANLRQKAEEPLVKQKSKVGSLSSETDNLKHIPETMKKLIKELQDIQQKFDALKVSNDITINELNKATKWSETLLSSLPHPAMYIRAKDRVVVSANRVALEMGVKIGGYCWREFMKGEYLSQKDKEIAAKYPDVVPVELGIKCSFCLSDKCFSDSPEQIDPDMLAFGLVWETYWIKISDEVYLHYAINITERKRAEKELLESENKYRELVDNSPDAIVIYHDNKIVFANNESLRLVGAESIENLLGKSLLEFVHPDSRAFVIERMRKIANNETILPLAEEKFVRSDGSEFEVEVKAIPIRFEQKPAVQLIIRNIDDRKQDEEILRLQSEIMTNMSEAIYMVTMADGIIVYVNQVFERMFGYEHDEMLGQHASIVNAPTEKSSQQTAKEIMEDINEHGYWKGEVENIRKDGTVFTCYASVTPFEHSKFGKVIVAIHTDISERKQAELTIIQSEKKYRYIVENVGEGIGFVNAAEEFVVANPAAERIFGVGKGELLGKNLKGFLSEDQYLAILNQTKTRKKGQESTYEFELTRQDGTKRSVFIIAVPQFDDNNEFVGTHGIFRDITEQKKAELALMESNFKFLSLANNISGYIAYVNADTMQYEFVNDLYEKSFGIPGEKIIGSHVKDVIGETNYQFALKYIKEVKSGKSVSYENTFDFTSGKRWIQTNYAPVIDSNGHITSIAVLSFDITESKQIHQELKENERKLYQLNADKDRFISILGHDLKNPFNNILGFSELLTADINSLNSDEIKEIAGNINKSAQITNLLLEEILMWARTQQGKIPFNPQKLSFSSICRNVLEILNPSAYAKNITIDDSSVGHSDVFADADMLKTIVLNLVSNAIKFTNNGGKITINSEQNAESATISVSDNGIGIPPNNLARMFNISEVITTKGTANETGSGLGLLLCKEFVEKHGGKIWVESEVGKGSDFKFTLPRFNER